MEIVVPRRYTLQVNIRAIFQIPELFDVVDPGTARDSKGVLKEKFGQWDFHGSISEYIGVN